MNFSSWSIRNPIAVILLFLMLTVAGLLCFSKMQIQNMPDMDYPMVTVTASLDGATPDQLENDVARKIENALVDLQGVRHISTTLGDGTVSLMVQFEVDKPIQEALDQVRSKVQGVRGDLPSALPEPVVDKVDVAGSQPVLAYAIQSDRMDMQELSWFVDNDLNRMLLGLKGVGKVTRVGGVTRQVHVDLDPTRLRALGLTVGGISEQLRDNQIESAGGHADIAQGKQPARVLARVKSAEQLKKVQITSGDGRRLLLGELGTVSDTIEEPTTSAWLDGKEIVGFEVSRSRGDSEVDVGQRVRGLVQKLQQDRPDLKLTETMDLATPAQEEFDRTMHTLYEGALLAVIVVWFFLRNWRATFLSAVALPMSVLPAFMGMYLFGFTLNHADSLIFQTEKQLKEFGDKLSADKKAAVESALAKLKEAHSAQNLDGIDAASAEVQSAFQAASEEMYNHANAAGAADPTAGAASGSASSSQSAGDNITDADFEEVK